MKLKKIDLWAVIVLICSGIIVSFGYNIYYFFDDYPYFHITENNIAFSGGILKTLYSYDVWGYYRPLVKLFWIAGYLLWGTFSYGYTTITAIFFMITIFMLYQTGKLLKNRLCGVITAFFYMTYYPVLQGSWYKCGISAYSEICFISLFLYFTLKWIKEGGDRFDRNAIMGIIFIFLSFISKETSLLLPLTLVPFLKMKRVRYFIVLTFAISLLTFFIPRIFFFSYELLRQPGFHPDKIFYLFDNFIRLQYLTLIGPYTLIAAFFSYRRKHALSLLGIFLFILIVERFFVSPANLPTHLDLILTITALVVSFGYTSLFKRFAIWWSVILLAPSFSMGDANIHQTFESCIGIALLLGLGFSDHVFMLKRMYKKMRANGFSESVNLTFKSISEATKNPAELIRSFPKFSRYFAILILLPLIFYSTTHIMKANLKESSAQYIYLRDTSNLTRMVREYLEGVLPPKARIHNNTMPAHISYPDLEYDLNLNGRMDITSDDDIKGGKGYIIFSGNLAEPIRDEISEIFSDAKKIKEFRSGSYYSVIYLR